MTGVRRFKATPAALAGLLLILVAPSLAAQRVALVIGNANYAHAPRLANPLNDAADIGAALARLGFAVTRIENANQAALHQGLKAFMRAASVSEVAVVFYAGHGIEVDRRNFLVPVDARLENDQDVEFETVPLELVVRSVARASGLRLVILDACRENPFAVSMQRAGATRTIGRGLARVEPAGETLVAYASKEGTVALDGEGRNSPYSAALLNHLEQPGLEVGLLFRKVRDAVLAATGGRQEPFVYGSSSSRGVYLAARLEPSRFSESEAKPVDDDSARLTAEEMAAERLAAERELLFWESVRDSEDAADIQAYLDRYRGGAYEVLARNRLKRLVESSTAAADSTTPPQEAPAPGPESVEAGLGLERSDRRLIQLGLKAADFDPGPADGLFGRRTRRAIGRWQVSRGEEATGYLEAESAKLLLASGEKRTAQAQERLGAERQRRRQEKASADDAAYAQAKSLGTMESYSAYLSAYPSGRHVEEARRLYAQVQAQKRKEGPLHDAMETLSKVLSIAERIEDGYDRSQAFADTAQAQRQRQVAEARRQREAAQEKARREARQKWEKLGLVMVRVDGGSFTMGCQSGRDSDCDDDEKPAHRVQVRSFEIGKYEVTQALWEAVTGENPSYFRGCAECPVERVSWDDVQRFLAELNAQTGKRYRLPTEAEWEYAARGGRQNRGYLYAGGNDAESAGWYVRNSGDKTHPVDQKRANELGLHDMSGNVREWVQDCWNDSYRGAPNDGRAWERGDCRRVARGGSWFNSPRRLRSANRSWDSSGDRYGDLGFRVTWTLTP